MMYFAFLAFAVFIDVLGYYLQITATTVEAAIVACRVSYVGIPLIGVLLYCFSRVYSDKPKLHPLVFAAMFLPALVFTLSVFMYPWLPFFFQDLQFSTSGLVNHLVVVPGLLYYLCIVYVTVFTIWGFITLMVSFIRQKRYEGAVIFFVAITIPLAVQFYNLIFGLIGGWNPQRTSLALSVVLLAIYLVRYKQAEWLSVGRELVVQDMKDAFILLDNKGVVIDHNLSAESYFPELKRGDQFYRLMDLWEFPAERYTAYSIYPYDMYRDGQEKHLRITTSPLEAKDKITGTLVIINDDSMTYEMIQELTRLARIDDLTGLRNRSTFFSDATPSFDLIQRQAETKGCALMMDIDYFKNVNDTYGHAMGDQVLTFIGDLIRKRFRHTDVYGRYGGEELSVWMPATDLSGAWHVAEEIRTAVEANEFVFGEATFHVTISIGIASMNETHPKDFEELVKQADQALYEAKNSGRNRTCVYHEDTVIQQQD